MLHAYEVDSANVILYLDVQALTAREIELLQFMADGYGRKESAVRLNVSLGRFRNQLTVIHEKLGVNDTLASVVVAMRQGWVR